MGDDNCRGDFHLACLNPLPNNFSRLDVEHLWGKGGVGGKSPMLKDGRPAIILTEEELLDLSMPLQLTLIGKFPAGRPKWVVVNNFFSDLKLQGEFKIVNLDARHMYIHLQYMDDYIRLFSKQFQYINGFLIKFLKWTLDFNVETEPSVCPVWISLPLLGLHLYTSNMLFSIASVFDRPLRLDYATRHWSRPSSARILVEIDLRIQHSNEVWIDSDSIGYFQKVCFENLSSYCLHCRKIGHSDDKCFVLFPELRKEHVHKNIIGKGQHTNDELPKGLEVNIDVEGGGCDASISNGVACLDLLGNSHGAGLVFLECVEGLQADLLDGNVSSLDSMVGQALLGAEKQFLHVDDVGKGCNHRDCASMDGGLMGSDLDISPRADFMLHSLPHDDSFDFSIAGSNIQNEGTTSKRFTRSSLKEIDGQQLFLQCNGNEKKMDKIFNLIDRVLDNNVRLEELKRHRENAMVLKEEERKRRKEKKVAAAARLQDKLESKKSQGKGKAYYFANLLPVELLPTIPIYGSSPTDGIHIWGVADYPLKAQVFTSKNSKKLVDMIGDICSTLQHCNTMFNLLITDCGTKMFLFPQLHMPENGHHLHAWECGGYFIYNRSSNFDSASEMEICKRLASVSIDVKGFQSLKQLCCGIIAKIS